MRTLSGLPPARRLEARFDEQGFDAARFEAGPERRLSRSPSRPANRPPSRHGAGPDRWTVFLLGALVAGLMGMLLGGALSV